jgi:hypothetical protein
VAGEWGWLYQNTVGFGKQSSNSATDTYHRRTVQNVQKTHFLNVLTQWYMKAETKE